MQSATASSTCQGDRNQLTPLRNRLDAARAREDTRQWVQDQCARTRHLIELGRLVQKAGLVELVDDDRAILFDAFLDVAARLQEEGQPEEGNAADLRALAAARIVRVRGRQGGVGGDGHEEGRRATGKGRKPVMHPQSIAAILPLRRT